jgi:hypothetical protein
MALPKIDSPVYEIDLPLSKKHIAFRPFLVKEQKNLLMALEANDLETMNLNVKQILTNCTLTEGVDIDSLPIVDIEYYFLHLRAKSVGEVVSAKYRCENVVEDKKCGNVMQSDIDLLKIEVTRDKDIKDIVQLNDKISIKLKYPQFRVIKEVSELKTESIADIALLMMVDSIDCIYDGQQTFYAKDSTREELVEFLESLNKFQFNKIQEFFENLPKLNKTVDIKCSKCGFEHTVQFEGLESFFD